VTPQPSVSGATFPSSRGQCELGPRPCPWQRCRHWLPDGGCVLDVAAAGPLSASEVAKVLGMRVYEVEDVEVAALAKLARLANSGRLDHLKPDRDLSLGFDLDSRTVARDRREVAAGTPAQHPATAAVQEATALPPSSRDGVELDDQEAADLRAGLIRVARDSSGFLRHFVESMVASLWRSSQPRRRARRHQVQLSLPLRARVHCVRTRGQVHTESLQT
jgi:hypothetical protein